MSAMPQLFFRIHRGHYLFDLCKYWNPAYPLISCRNCSVLLMSSMISAAIVDVVVDAGFMEEVREDVAARKTFRTCLA